MSRRLHEARLLDHCVPRRVRQALVACDAATAFGRGGRNRERALLKAAEDAGFDVPVRHKTRGYGKSNSRRGALR